MDVSAQVSNVSQGETHAMFSPSFRLTAALLHDILLILSLFINLLQLAAYIKGRKVLKTMPFFIISSQMLINNLLVLFVMITLMTTAAISDQRILSDKIYYVLSFAEGFAYNGLLLFAFLLTLNRMLVFAFPKCGRFIFDGSRIYITIVVFWILVGLVQTSIMTSPCPVVAKPADLGFAFECIEGQANIFNYITQYLSSYIPIIMIVQYILIYIEIKIGIFCNSFCCSLSNLLPKNYKKRTQNLAEIKLLIQAAMICSTFFIQNFCWTYLPFITAKFAYEKELIFFAVMLSSILLYSVNAAVVLIFNGQVRRIALSFFKKENVIPTSSFAPTRTLSLY